MKKRNIRISTKIKFYGLILISIMMMAIMITIYFNDKNVKDSLLINIAGEQRMLTQKITKDVFYLHQSQSGDYSNLEKSIDKFVENSKYIKDSNEIKNILASPDAKISSQISKVDKLWAIFHTDVKNCALAMNSPNQEKKIKRALETIYEESDILLREVNELVTMLTLYNENKNENIKNIQHLFAFLLFALTFYIVSQLKHIEAGALSFMEYSKNLAFSSETLKIEPMPVEAEKELIEMDEIVQSFANKINSAIDFSNEALSQSEKASLKLEEMSEEFDHILDELSHNPNASVHLNNSEDIMIEYTEELFSSTRKLHKLKEELDKLLRNCVVNTINPPLS
jgi:hypothetical protein